MSGFKAGPGIIRVSGLAVVAALFCGATTLAEARGGFFDFFGQAFGGDSPSLSQTDGDGSEAPPLVVRAHPRRHRLPPGVQGGSQRYDTAALKDVTIYTDRTLVRGDAVMTSNGVKVFNGSASWPHTDEDFTAVADTSRVSPSVRKELTAINAASSPRWQR